MQMATWSPARSPAAGQQPGQPVGAVVELAVGDHLPGAGHDVGGLVGGGLGNGSRVHGGLQDVEGVVVAGAGGARTGTY